MRQASRNTQEGISLFQVAEGALESIQSAAIRMSELAIQSATDTLGDAERQFADKEYQALKTEVMRVSAATNYNGQYLLNGSGEKFEMQVGIFNNSNERIDYDMSKIIRKTNNFGAGSTSITTKESSQRAIESIQGMISEISGSRAQIGAVTNRMQTAINNNMTADENLSTSKSKIRDADYALEASRKARADLIKEGSTRVLREANNMNEGTLKLVG
jgi:flagellin